MKFFFHNLEIFISKENCRNISGSGMCIRGDRGHNSTVGSRRSKTNQSWDQSAE